MMIRTALPGPSNEVGSDKHSYAPCSLSFRHPVSSLSSEIYLSSLHSRNAPIVNMPDICIGLLPNEVVSGFQSVS